MSRHSGGDAWRRARGAREAGFALGLMVMMPMGCAGPVTTTAAPSPAPARPEADPEETVSLERDAPVAGDLPSVVVPLLDGAMLRVGGEGGDGGQGPAPRCMLVGVLDAPAGPPMDRVLEVGRAEGVELVVVSLDPLQDPAARLASEGVAVGWDPEGVVALQLRVVDLPTLLRFDADGRLIEVRAPLAPDALVAEDCAAPSTPKVPVSGRSATATSSPA